MHNHCAHDRDVMCLHSHSCQGQIQRLHFAERLSLGLQRQPLTQWQPAGLGRTEEAWLQCQLFRQLQSVR